MIRPPRVVRAAAVVAAAALLLSACGSNATTHPTRQPTSPSNGGSLVDGYDDHGNATHLR